MVSIIALIAVVVVTVICLLSNNSDLKLEVYDNKGEKLTTATSLSQYKNDSNSEYLDVVLNEAIEIYAEKNSCSLEQAQKRLLKERYKIYTYFDASVSKNLKTVCAGEALNYDVGAAVTTLKGELVAVASSSAKNNGKRINYSTTKKQPCSAFKPLSVYAPAIENKNITWSTMVKDSPYSQIKADDGKLIDWPRNANNTYSYENVTITDAISSSLNTVAVKCLSQLGVKNSIDFLSKSFSINLDYEKAQLKAKGENEIIGNIALGSLNVGCSPIEMAGYYQIFANGGSYYQPKAISKICTANGDVVYEQNKEGKQVISRETAQIINGLLQKVVTGPKGTGRKAFCKNIPVAGKTGTSENNEDNWFVGITPQYSCAIWHSKAMKNNCPEMFSKTFQSTEHEVKLFSTSPNVINKMYCLKSGKLATKNCKTFDIGIYAYGAYLSSCDVHK